MRRFSAFRFRPFRINAGSRGGLLPLPSATFNGTADFVSCGDVEDVGTNDWTVTAWYKTSVSSGLRAIITKNPNAGNDRWGLYLNAGRPIFVLQTTSAFNKNADTLNTADGLWHHHAVTLDRDGLMTHYTDGVADGTLDISSEVARDISNTTALRVGRSNAEFWSGELVDVRLFHAALSGPQVASVRANSALGTERAHIPLTEGSGTTANDISGNGNNGAITATDINAFWANKQSVYR